MLAFLKANYLTILIILVLVAIVVGIICSIVKDKKPGATPAALTAPIAPTPAAATSSLRRKRDRRYAL